MTTASLGIFAPLYKGRFRRCEIDIASNNFLEKTVAWDVNQWAGGFGAPAEGAEKKREE
jgi:hypothetical protein